MCDFEDRETRPSANIENDGDWRQFSFRIEAEQLLNRKILDSAVSYRSQESLCFNPSGMKIELPTRYDLVDAESWTSEALRYHLDLETIVEPRGVVFVLRYNPSDQRWVDRGCACGAYHADDSDQVKFAKLVNLFCEIYLIDDLIDYSKPFRLDQ